MIDASQFVEAARARGFDWYAGVPCSYLTPFINYVLQDPSLHYVSAANEGDAVALTAGIALAGKRGITMMQNSGLGNAVSPLTSLTWTFRLPQLLIVTWRGQPGVSDEPQHALMGPVTPQMLDTMEIPWETFPTEADAIGPALDRALAHMDSTGRPYALVMQKGSVAPYELKDGAAPARHAHVAAQTRFGGGVGVEANELPSRRDALERVIAATPADSTVVLASTGFCGRELYALDDRANQLYMVGSMGCVTPFALGFALARPDLNVVALDGDGAALMRMGAFATLGAYGPSNLTHVLLDNGAHDSTGGQATVSPQVSFAGVAAACGYADAIESDDLAVLDDVLAAARERRAGASGFAGTRFVRIAIRRGTPDGLPRPTITPPDVKTRLMRHIGAEQGAH
ncbi:phosphonopyruvate decarboxylase [Paraburkholderia caballeronis]|uniref:Phosphonopyruvate decarboxylase n=1 Tax=Paraburkholderia caballeronis TaxID=416943 RepID=A0A1H7TUE3_9BURK|nr:phosphonopyruvate decarboxylase [Paraburkholderia caballeronis]PXW17656.1 phosphonopyruvate decarboxylase [Paraburkholderia caballeronis]PXW95401.1 phosphonopyruvate decarboxylase [Paraburkholderia caballeronis]RAJ91215.1 phosphonopyruvate decarboxylase [Paraburkholderia caballeronis]TDV26682.1 phosphonopyruvate decarboxylase [Paraburkholderia caballeronis]SEE12487.1 phosphonopyruvate decarboxylase [Paraburkholderia caballeronis]